MRLTESAIIGDLPQPTDTPDRSMVANQRKCAIMHVSQYILPKSRQPRPHADGRFGSRQAQIPTLSHDASEVFMATDIKPLRDQIAAASAELKLARYDGSAQRIADAAAALDELIDSLPRSARQENA